MRNLLALAATALIVFAAVGWYLGWYSVSSITEPDGHKDIHINLNNPKIAVDVKKAEEELAKKLQQQSQQQQTGGPPAIPVSNTGAGTAAPGGPPPVTGTSNPSDYVPRSVPPINYNE
jgi:hypothetical protein